MPSWDTLDPSGREFHPLKEQEQVKERTLPADQSTSAIHKLLIPPGKVPYLSVVGDHVLVEFKDRSPPCPRIQSDADAYYDALSEWVDAQAADASLKHEGV